MTGLVEAYVSGESSKLDNARRQLIEATDHATMVDAAAVIANFEMMTRIADGTGTTHSEARLEGLTEARTELGLDDFVSSRSPATS